MLEKIIKQELIIKCQGADALPIDSILEFQGGLKKISKKNLDKLKSQILQRGFIAPIFIWDDHGINKIIDGHGRLKALLSFREEGYNIPLIPVDYIHASDKAEARKILLAITSQYGEFDDQELKTWLDELDESDRETLRLVDGKDILDNINIKRDEKIKECNDFIDSLESRDKDELLLKLFDTHDHFFMSYSGGKDSTSALLSVLPFFKRHNKKLHICFVQNGVEFPDLLAHIYRTTRSLDCGLKIINSKNTFFDVYKEKWPNPIFMDCIERLVSSPLDSYCKEIAGKDDYVLFRGGKKNQKLNSKKGKIKKGVIQKVLKNTQMTICNIEYFSKEVNQLTEYKWPGYDLGFDRTACWCCPFQKSTQWDALKKYYPMLWNELKYMFKTLILHRHAGDGFIKRIESYWGKECKLQICESVKGSEQEEEYV